MLLLWIKIGIHNTQFRGGIWRIPNSKKTKKEIWKSTPTKWISDVFVHDNKFVIWLTWFYPFNLAIAEKEGKRLILFFNETIRLHKPDWQHLTNRDLYQFNEHYSIVQMIARNAWTNTILEHKQFTILYLCIPLCSGGKSAFRSNDGNTRTANLPAGRLCTSQWIKFAYPATRSARCTTISRSPCGVSSTRERSACAR